VKPYRPSLTRGATGEAEQSFTANVVHIEDALIAFGEIVEAPPRGLPFGTPVHSLLVHFEGDRLALIEFNDQGNTVEADAVSRIELARDHLRIHFHEGAGPFAGRVSLAPEIEIFRDEEGNEGQLGTLCVHFNVDDSRFEVLRRRLATGS